MSITNRLNLNKQLITLKIKRSGLLSSEEMAIMGLDYNIHYIVNMENRSKYKKLTSEDMNNNALSLFNNWNKKSFDRKCMLINSILETEPQKGSTTNFYYRYKVSKKIYKTWIESGIAESEIKKYTYSFKGF